MKILFVHQNFPGQFLHLAPALAARGHEVLALTAEANQRPSPVPVMRYRTPPEVAVQGIARSYAEAAERGATVARACAQLSETRGFVPDVVFGHGGWGETMYLREVWPEARHLTYAEFYYRSRGLDTDFDPEFRRTGLGSRLGVASRKAHLLMALEDADAALAPTAWQASTLPDHVRAKTTVIHDGIDTDRVRPDPAARLELPGGRVLKPGDEVVSFVSRNLEPYRGIHVFLRALPAVLEARPEAEVVIVGGEGQSYGPAPGPGQSWKRRFLDELGPRIDPARVHFLGQVPYRQFLALMQVTRVHAYLSYPFVLSWSMLEAMSAGALVVGSRTPPVVEVIRDGGNGLLVEFFDVAGWSRALISALADPARDAGLRAAARQTIIEGYDLKSVCLPRLIAFVEGRAQG
ncbi:glycosyltransferase [Defluviimonas sp. WL0024]|uniref:Glycosyltransferase n=1 Tax=Albidovulum salinarum TaxID=2984153 RepID=A0ABT2X8B9_9RHOB|nr:glycosyltransferase [Defluviimonas sp. WL0024]MCU9850196.1 glycosyltransferase [Defluviimonas sp. WL0024]